jgi:hypothetical protein
LRRWPAAYATCQVSGGMDRLLALPRVVL